MRSRLLMSAAILMAGVAVASAQSVGDYGRPAGDPHRAGYGRVYGGAVHRVRDRRPSLASDRSILDRAMIERRPHPARDRQHDLSIDRAILDRALTERRPGRDIDRRDGFASDRATFDRAMAEGRRQYPSRRGAAGDHAGRDYGLAAARVHGHPPGRHDGTVADHPRHDHAATARAAARGHAARRHARGHDHSSPATAETTGSATEHQAATPRPAHGRGHTAHDTTRRGAPHAHAEAHHAVTPPEPSHAQDRITKVQGALNQQGFDVGNPDGKLGKRTVDAVKAFQKKRGFKTTGKLDHATVDAILAAAVAAPATPPDMQTPAPFAPAPAAGDGLPPVQPVPADPGTTGQGGGMMPAPPIIERVPAETPLNPPAPDPSAPVAAPPAGTPQDTAPLGAPGR